MILSAALRKYGEPDYIITWPSAAVYTRYEFVWTREDTAYSIQFDYRNESDTVRQSAFFGKYFGKTEELLLHHSNKRQVQVMEICDCTQHSYYSWFNRSRLNVRIPLLALCKLAVAANVDVFDLMTE